jgi:hypothetical protein
MALLFDDSPTCGWKKWLVECPNMLNDYSGLSGIFGLAKKWLIS